MAATYNLGVAQGIIRITYDPKGVAEAEAGQEKLAATSKKTSATMAKAGKAAAVGGLIIAGGLALAAKEAADFQAKMTLLVTAGGESQAALGAVSKGIEQIAIQTGTSLTEAADGMYIVEKAGIRGAKGLNVLKAAAEGARAEGVDLQVMTQGLTSIMQSYADTMKDPIVATNELVVAAGMAKTTMQNFVNSLPNVLPLASAVGISFAQVGAAIATMTQHGTSAAEATQELNNTIRGLVAPNQVAIKAMQQLGINVVDLEKNVGKRGLAGSIDLVVNAIGKHMGPAGTVVVDTFKKSQSAGEDLQIMLSKMPKDLQALSKGFLDGTVSAKEYRQGFRDMGAQGSAMGMQFMQLAMQANGFNDLLKAGSPAAATFTAYLKQIMGGATGMNTALQLSGASAGYFTEGIKRINAASKESGKDISTWAQTQKNANVQLGRLKASGQVLAVELGTHLLPTIVKIANALTAAIQWFADLSDTQQNIIVGTLAAAAAFLLLASSIIKLYKMVKMLQEIGLAVKALTIWTKLAAAAQWLWDGALAAFAALEEITGIGLIVAAIVALVAIIILVIKYHQQIWNAMKTAWGAIWSFMKTIGAWFAGPFVNFFIGVWHQMQAIWNGIVAVFTTAFKILMIPLKLYFEFWRAIWNLFWPITKAVFDLIVAIVKLAIAIIKAVIQTELLIILTIWRTVTHALEAAWRAVWGAIVGVLRAVWAVIGPTIINHLHEIQSIWNSIWHAIVGVARVIWGQIVSYIRSHVALILSAVHTLTRLAGIVGGFFQSMYLAVVAKVGKVVSYVAGIGGKIIHAIGNLGSLLYNAGKDVIQGLINGIASKINALTSKLKSITNLIPKIKGPEEVDAKLLTPNGETIMAGLVAGIENGRPSLERTLKKLTKSVPVSVTASYAGQALHPITEGSGGSPKAGIPPHRFAPAPKMFGPYKMTLDGKVFHEFVIDAVTGAPKIISKTTQRGNRKRAWAGGRKTA